MVRGVKRAVMAPDPCKLLRRCFCEPVVWRAWGPPAPISRPDSLMEKRVEIYGMNREDMNGKCGVATDFHTVDLKDPTTWCYTVELDDGEAFMVRTRREG